MNNFFVRCEYSPMHDWAVYALWYSISKNIVDGVLNIYCQRQVCNLIVFEWPRRMNVKLSFNKPPENVLLLDPFTVCLSEYDKNIGPVDVSSTDKATFVSYKNGFGKFIPSKWINTARHPFDRAVRRFSGENPTFNELGVLEIWEQAKTSYQVVK